MNFQPAIRKIDPPAQLFISEKESLHHRFLKSPLDIKRGDLSTRFGA